MSVNSSSSVGDILHCHSHGQLISTYFSITSALLLVPLAIVVLLVGYCRWLQGHASHSDVFAFHSVVLNLISSLGNILYITASHLGLTRIIMVGGYMSSGYIPTLILFHVLTCVERYVAVVHPVIYLGLRQSRGVRIRNISIACVWLQSLAWIGISHVYNPDIPRVPYFVFLSMSLLVISFCCTSVLCVLIRPGPGDTGGDRQKLDQSKRRAFNTMSAIFAVLWVFFVNLIVTLAVEKELERDVGCLMLVFSLWFSLPVSLVLPLLFMHRCGKLC